MFGQDAEPSRLARWLSRAARNIRALPGKSSSRRLDWWIGRIPGAPPEIDHRLQELTLRYNGFYVGDASKSQIALTFDVASSTDTPALLAVLEAHNAKATFFLTGEWVERNPAVFREIVRIGHVIGNHSYSHPDLSTISLGQVATELRRTDELMMKLGGRKPTFFRPPFGYFSESVLRRVSAMGYRTAFWSISMRDWEPMDLERLVRGVIDYLHQGAVVLLHVTPEGVSALDTTIPRIRAGGYELVTLSQLVGN